MGAKIGDIVIGRKIDVAYLSGKIVAVDALNVLYSFVLTIKDKNGAPLVDRAGRITSHLVGLFHRTAWLIENSILPVFVFDGEPPTLKGQEIRKRRLMRRERGAVSITDEMIEESKKLLEYLGVPSIQAPREGEEMAAHIVKKGDAFAVVSQDRDALLFGAPRLVRNLTLTGRRKIPKTNKYVRVYPEIIILEEILKNYSLTFEQFVAVGVIAGSDYGEGLKGVGAKTAIKLIKEYKTLETIAKIKEAPELIDIANIYLHPKVTDDYTIRFQKSNIEKIREFLCEEHDFSQERVDKEIDRLLKSPHTIQQTLDEYNRRFSSI